MGIDQYILPDPVHERNAVVAMESSEPRPSVHP